MKTARGTGRLLRFPSPAMKGASTRTTAAKVRRDAIISVYCRLIPAPYLRHNEKLLRHLASTLGCNAAVIEAGIRGGRAAVLNEAKQNARAMRETAAIMWRSGRKREAATALSIAHHVMTGEWLESSTK